MKARIGKWLLTAVCALAACAGFAQENVTVSVIGVGTDEETAMLNAKQNAVAQVCGEIVKSDATLQQNGNDTKLQESVRTFTNGFVLNAAVEKAFDGKQLTARIIIQKQKMKDWMPHQTVALDCARLMGDKPLTTIRPTEIQIRQEQFKKMLIPQLEMYYLLLQAVPVQMKIVFDDDGNPHVVVNYDLLIQPQDYRNYLAYLERSVLIPMGFSQYGGNERRQRPSGGLLISYNPNPADERSAKRWYMKPVIAGNGLWISQYFDGFCSHINIGVKFSLLNKKGEEIASQQYLMPGQCYNWVWKRWNIYAVDREISIGLPNGTKFARKGWIKFNLTDPSEMEKIDKVVATTFIWRKGNPVYNVERNVFNNEYYPEE